MAIKLYIFDMGGVVTQTPDVVEQICEFLKIGREQFDHYSLHALEELSDGKITSPQFWRQFSEASGIPVTRDLLVEFFRPTVDLEVVQLIHELKDKARVVCGTNTNESHYQYHQTHQEYDMFDTVYASHIIGISKPKTGFYRYILEQEKIAPEAGCFIDDRVENTAAAAKLGIKAITFTGIADLRAHL